MSQFKATRSSAIAEGPRDASCQLKSCQLPCNRAETTCTSSEQIEVKKLAGYSPTLQMKNLPRKGCGQGQVTHFRT